MKRGLWSRIEGLTLLAGLICLGCVAAFAGSEGTPQAAAELTTVGTPGPKAIQLKIWTDKPESHVFRAGDSIVLHVRADRRACIAVVYISSKGDAIVLFPNAQTPDNLILPGRDYTLFGDSAPIKLKISETMKEGRIVVFSSSSPLPLDSLGAVSESKPCIQIPSSAPDRLDALKGYLERASKDEGFNRVVLALKGGGAAGLSLKLMGLPTAVKSEKPETVTGVQGLRPEKINDR
jgi:hypothetical protein